MRILGIDPGLRVTGFGVIDQNGHQLTYVASGIIKTADADLPSRLGTIFEGISTLVRQHAPDQSAIEKVFVNVNPQSTLLLGRRAARQSARW
jgi:crossover junction endodeoxyribonuclease RuvC